MSAEYEQDPMTDHTESDETVEQSTVETVDTEVQGETLGMGSEWY